MLPFINALKAWVLLYFQGMIVLWSGAVVDIPDDWQLCDGTNGTPDLRDKFVAGAGSTYAPDGTGGSDDHRHILDADAHSHDIDTGTDIAAGDDFSKTFQGTKIVGATTYTDHHPPYYALAYIMKL